ncbi:glycosyltransferase family 2 protein [Candidatus Woesearchaeota archaeon]|nr:glycosyltransferase family 2 protein [Candidatus Woesearchaeota archaeon]
MTNAENINLKEDVCIIIPIHNEEINIQKVIFKCKKYVRNVIVVDDGSTDKSYNIAENSGVIILRHIVNLGKGAALKTGCDYAIRSNAKILVFIDGDGQHDADMIPFFIEKLKECDIAIGVRKFNKKMPFVMKFGNNFINFIINLLFHVKISDSQSGYRAVWADKYRQIRWKAQDYSMESEMIANIGKHRLRYSQVPIPTIYNDEYKGTTVVDGFRIVYNIIKWKLAGL